MIAALEDGKGKRGTDLPALSEELCGCTATERRGGESRLDQALQWRATGGNRRLRAVRLTAGRELSASMPQTSKPSWEIEFTPEAETWYKALNAEDTSRVTAAINRLERTGPALGRPFVDSIKGSRHHNMKELRSSGGNLRALFAFDPHRRAVVLVGGDKTGDWSGWYKRNIRQADRLYDQYLRGMGKEGPCRPSPRRAGRPSADRSR